jgi:hypothetical protein
MYPERDRESVQYPQRASNRSEEDPEKKPNSEYYQVLAKNRNSSKMRTLSAIAVLLLTVPRCLYVALTILEYQFG